ncbi:hypothetical protein KCP75_22880 [Salmonella enterica subsp. enterica]|nr:hypothetical protein KCP75_22880 [Salmonella enterica subsp. enterica]
MNNRCTGRIKQYSLSRRAAPDEVGRAAITVMKTTGASVGWGYLYPALPAAHRGDHLVLYPERVHFFHQHYSRL